MSRCVAVYDTAAKNWEPNGATAAVDCTVRSENGGVVASRIIGRFSFLARRCRSVTTVVEWRSEQRYGMPLYRSSPWSTILVVSFAERAILTIESREIIASDVDVSVNVDINVNVNVNVNVVAVVAVPAVTSSDYCYLLWLPGEALARTHARTHVRRTHALTHTHTHTTADSSNICSSFSLFLLFRPFYPAIISVFLVPKRFSPICLQSSFFSCASLYLPRRTNGSSLNGRRTNYTALSRGATLL